MTLNSEAAKRKWESIASSEKATLDKIVSGKGTPADYKRMTDLLQQYSSIASDLFRRGVTLISKEAARKAEEETAASESGSPEAEQDRLRAVQHVFSEKVPDLLEAVKELVEDAETPADSPDSFLPDRIVTKDGNVIKKRVDPTENKSTGSTTDYDDADADLLDKAPSSDTTANEQPLTPVSVENISAEAQEKLNDISEERRSWVKDWWRNFKGFVGRNTPNGSLLKELATLAASAYAFSPQIRDWVNEKFASIADYMSDTYLGQLALGAWDYIKANYEKFTTLEYWSGLMDSVWTSIKEEGKAVLDYILNTFEELKNWGSEKWDQAKTGATNWTLGKFDDTKAWWAKRNSDSYAEDIAKTTKRVQEMKDYKAKLNKPESDREHQNLNIIIARKEQEIEELKAKKEEADKELRDIESGRAAREGTGSGSGGASGTWAESPSTSASTSPSGGSSTVAASASTSPSGGSATVAASAPSTSASQPGVKVESAAKPPETANAPPDQASSENRGRTSMQSNAQSIDSFGFAPNVDDRLLLANMLE